MLVKAVPDHVRTIEDLVIQWNETLKNIVRTMAQMFGDIYSFWNATAVHNLGPDSI